jgi:lysozyme
LKITQSGIDLIVKYEGVKLTPYKCPAGLWTCGVGHLIGDGKSLPDSWNKRFTITEVYSILSHDLIKYENAVNRYIKVPLTQNQFNALVSFTYNLGIGTLQRSSLRQKVNRGDMDGARKVLLKYNKAGGKVLKGLDLRRKAEALLFIG